MFEKACMKTTHLFILSLFQPQSPKATSQIQTQIPMIIGIRKVARTQTVILPSPNLTMRMTLGEPSIKLSLVCIIRYT